MRAVVFDFSIPRYVAAKALGRRMRSLYDGPLSCIRMRDDVPAPALPGDDWVRLEPISCGVCGTDLATVYLKASPTLSPYATFPFVPGHEVLARVSDVGRSVKSVREGDRVIVDPWLRCELRGAPPCARCAAGEYGTCERAATGPRRGMMIGASSELPGGWGEQMVAHESQLFLVPSSMSDDRAAIAEPMAIGLHAVMRNKPREGEHVLVIGGGAIAYAVLFALREAAPRTDITLIALEASQLEMARALGADRAWAPQGEPIVDRAARLTGGVPLKPELGPRFLAGGFDAVFDCVGTRESLYDAMSLARAGATIVMVGAASVLTSIDMTHLWTKELHLVGTLAYDYDERGGERQRTFAITRELLTSSPLPVEKLVTHRFRLEDFREALHANLDRKASGAFKTLLVP